MSKSTKVLGFLILATAALLSVTTSAVSAAATPTGDFSLEVSPSTLVTTVKPAVETTLDLKVRNTSKNTENLKIELRSFKINDYGQGISLSDSTPPDLAKWVSLDSPTFTAKPGEWSTLHISVHLPSEAGFSYPFAVVISRVDSKATESSGRLLEGSVAVFALVNIDKPGATRVLGISKLKPSHRIYEFLPADIDLELRNTGNSIVQPYGNIYIQRSSNDPQPLSVLALNDERGYILPGTTRDFHASWTKGFPYYKTVTKDGKNHKELVWDWSALSQFRIGRYTAKVVAVYNDGIRDVPVIGEVTFWVIPWRILLGALVVVVLIGLGLWSAIRQFSAGISRLKR